MTRYPWRTPLRGSIWHPRCPRKLLGRFLPSVGAIGIPLLLARAVPDSRFVSVSPATLSAVLSAPEFRRCGADSPLLIALRRYVGSRSFLSQAHWRPRRCALRLRVEVPTAIREAPPRPAARAANADSSKKRRSATGYRNAHAPATAAKLVARNAHASLSQGSAASEKLKKRSPEGATLYSKGYQLMRVLSASALLSEPPVKEAGRL